MIVKPFFSTAGTHVVRFEIGLTVDEIAGIARDHMAPLLGSVADGMVAGSFSLHPSAAEIGDGKEPHFTLVIGHPPAATTPTETETGPADPQAVGTEL